MVRNTMYRGNGSFSGGQCGQIFLMQDNLFRHRAWASVRAWKAEAQQPVIQSLMELDMNPEVRMVEWGQEKDESTSNSGAGKDARPK